MSFGRVKLSLQSISCSVLLVSLLTPVYANQLSPWQGLYIGGYGGVGFNQTKVSTSAGSVGSTSYFNDSADVNAVNNAGTFSYRGENGIAGFEVGENWALNHFVLGVLADYSGFSASSSKSVASQSYPSGSGSYSETISTDLNWLFTLRGRLGYGSTVHQWPSLFYVTAGPVLTKVKMDSSFSDSSSYAGAGGSGSSSYQLGWSAGAGLELFASHNFSIGMEYLYVQIPSVENDSAIGNSQAGFGVPSGSLSSPFVTSGKFSLNLLKVGLNYQF